MSNTTTFFIGYLVGLIFAAIVYKSYKWLRTYKVTVYFRGPLVTTYKVSAPLGHVTVWASDREAAYDQMNLLNSKK